MVSTAPPPSTAVVGNRLLLSPTQGPTVSSHHLNYRMPAEAWVEATPIGNGRLAAMCFGRVQEDLILVNEGSLWSGGPTDPQPHPVSATTAREVLAGARDALADSDFTSAERHLQRLQHGYPQSFLPLLEIHRQLDGRTLTAPTTYRRDLDLSTAIAST